MNAKLDDTLTHARYFSLLLPLACHLAANAFPITLFFFTLGSPRSRCRRRARRQYTNNASCLATTLIDIGATYQEGTL